MWPSSNKYTSISWSPPPAIRSSTPRLMSSIITVHDSAAISWICPNPNSNKPVKSYALPIKDSKWITGSWLNAYSVLLFKSILSTLILLLINHQFMLIKIIIKHHKVHRTNRRYLKKRKVDKNKILYKKTKTMMILIDSSDVLVYLKTPVF